MKQKTLLSLTTQQKYETEICLGHSEEELVSLLKSLSDSFVLVTHNEIKTLYGDGLIEHMLLHLCNVKLITIPSGEHCKTRETAANLQDFLLKEGCDRNTLIIALGGGVLSDVVGFVAATTIRGLPWMVIPTTLLAMVDAAIGGKTGVNTSIGKNMVGCIHPPTSIWIDLSFLKTLPHREWVNGFAEIIKYGAILDGELFSLLETESFSDVTQLPQATLEYLIARSCQHKLRIVEQDLRDHSIRTILNFGHTVGHAIEQLYDYAISHGEAVAIGMLVEGYMSMSYGLSEQDFLRLYTLIRRSGFSLRLPYKTTLPTWIDLISRDKKSLSKQPRCVLLKAIGSVHAFDGYYCRALSNEELKIGYEWMCREFII